MSLSIRLPLLLSLLVLACAARTVPDDAAGGSGGASGERGDQGGTHVGGTAGGGRSAGGTGGTLPRGGAGGAAGRDGTSGMVGRGGSAGTSGDDAGGVGGEPGGAGGHGGDGGGAAGGDPGGEGGDGAGGGAGTRGDFDLEIFQRLEDYYLVGHSAPLVIGVINHGPLPAESGVVVTDLPDSAIAVASVGDEGWTCDAGSGALTCRYGEPIPPNGYSPYLRLQLTAGTDAGAPFHNTARLASEGDTNAENDVSVETLLVEKPVDLAIALDFPQYSPSARVTVTNVGSSPTFLPITASCIGYPLTWVYVGPEDWGDGWRCWNDPQGLGSVICYRETPLAPGEALDLVFSVGSREGSPGYLTCYVDTAGDLNGVNDESRAPRPSF